MLTPYTTESYRLLHEGSLALSEVEANGIRIDEGYLDSAIKSTRREIDELKVALESQDVVKVWRKKFPGSKFNLGSTDQLAKVLFEDMGFECKSKTATGKPKTNEEALSLVDNPFVKEYLQLKKLQKSLGTYLKGIKREIVDGFIHPSFGLHTTKTYRSSSFDPNFQNIPIRNPDVSKLIRTAFIPRPGNRLVELDYKGIEVAVAACYHKDPTMMDYLRDKTKDMHRDMAMECYMLPLSELEPSDKKDKAEVKRAKNIRYCGKNKFIFPQFYGDWYVACAQALWEAADSMELHRRDGTPLQQHLRQQGITGLGALDFKADPIPGTFEAHLKEVQRHFWEDRFPVYAQWKKDWVRKYNKLGYAKTKTGFILQGYAKKNQIINWPVQGSAFHCLLWSLTQLVRKELKQRKMKALIIGQIHDSIISDVPDLELDEFLTIANEVSSNRLKEHWDWIVAPIEIEAEVTPVDGNWFTKEERKLT